MRKPKFTEKRIAFALKQAETRTTVEDICRKMGISQATVYAWDKTFGGLGVAKWAQTCGASIRAGARP